MARKNKPVKIKRYKNSMGTGTNAVYKIKRIVPVVLGIVVLVLAGFLMGQPIMNMLAGETDTSSQSQKPSSKVETSSKVEVSSKTETTSQPIASEDESSANAQDTPLVVEKNRVYYYADAVAISTEAGLDGVVAKVKAAGATHLVFDVKNQDGTVMYISQKSSNTN